jgi:hypothetical protein
MREAWKKGCSVSFKVNLLKRLSIYAFIFSLNISRA